MPPGLMQPLAMTLFGFSGILLFRDSESPIGLLAGEYFLLRARLVRLTSHSVSAALQPVKRGLWKSQNSLIRVLTT
jgi:hypothetical protein